MTALARHGGAAGELQTAPELVRRVLATLRRRWLVAVAMLALTIAGALAITLAKPAAYSATAQILLAPSDAVGQLVSPGSLPSPANAQRDVDTNAKLITTHPVLELVRAQLRSSASDDELAAKVQVSGQAESSLVSITVTDASIAAARRLATALAQQYTRYRRASARDAVRQAIVAGHARLDEMRLGGATREDRAALRARLAELETNAAVTTGGVQIVHVPGGGDAAGLAATTLEDAAARTAAAARPAEVVKDNLTPRKLALTLVVAALAGALLALAAAFAIDAKDRRLLSVEDVDGAFGVPVLGCVPGRSTAGVRDGDRAVVGAYADLTASLGYTGVGGPRTLMISPVGSGLSGSPVAARMAAQLAALRRRVMVVDANLAAAPRASGPSCGGLAEVLAGERSLAEELAIVHIVPPPEALHAGEVLSYELLPAGDAVSNPAALLGRPVLAAIMRDALARADVVLVDAGPPAPVSQCAPLAALSDRIVLLAQLRGTTTADAVAARRTLGPLYERVAGVVVVVSDRRGLRRGPRLPMVAVVPPAAEPRTDVAPSNASPTNGTWPPAGSPGARRERERV